MVCLCLFPSMVLVWQCPFLVHSTWLRRCTLWLIRAAMVLPVLNSKKSYITMLGGLHIKQNLLRMNEKLIQRTCLDEIVKQDCQSLVLKLL